MKTEALINPATLRAARERAGLEIAAVAAKLHIADAEEQLQAWESGTERPSFAQARRLAHALHVPFASLFMDHTVLGSSEIPDLRTIGARRSRFSVDLLDVYHDALRKQAWVRDVRQNDGFDPIHFVGAGRGIDDASVGAGALTAALQLTAADRANTRTTDDYFRLLVMRAEAAGVLVLRSSTVGANTHRALDVDEFRGFAIADGLAPLVFVNTADAKAAQVFTLIHELAHIWRAETGVSQPSLEAPRTPVRDVEAACDQIAAELLVPEQALRAAWIRGAPLRQNGEALRRQFKVSGMVVARRALDIGLITRSVYGPYITEQMKLVASRPEAGGAPPYLVMVASRNGTTVTEMVARAVRAGELLWRDAGSLLGVTPKIIGQLTGQQAAR